MERAPFRLESVATPESRATFAKLTALLSAAFYNDPFYGYFMPDAGRRAARLDWWMTVFLKNGLLSGELLVTGTPFEPTGVAIWLGPRKPVPGTLRVARLGLIEAPFRLGLGGFQRMMTVTDHWQRLHRQEATPHWYLNFLAVHPSKQGQGLGGTLLRAITGRADAERVGCYLETCTEANVRLYARHGFEVVNERAWTDGPSAWTSWTMRRRPK